MYKILFIIFLCLAGIASSAPEQVDFGEYKVSFDLGLDKDEYEMNASGPIHSEDLGGKERKIWSINIGEADNDDLIIEIAKIVIVQAEGIEVQNEEELGERIYGLGLKVYGSSTNTRIIDGREAAIAEAKIGIKNSVFGELPLTGYFTAYKLDNSTAVDIFSSYGWDDGTLSLLKSLKVERS